VKEWLEAVRYYEKKSVGLDPTKRSHEASPTAEEAEKLASSRENCFKSQVSG